MAKVYEFSANPESEFKNGILAGFNENAISGSEYDSERAKNLYDTLDASMDDEEYMLGELPSGKWALIGLTISGYEFAVED